MKITEKEINRADLYTQKDLALALKLKQSNLAILIKKGFMPKPEVVIKKSSYYSEPQILTIINDFKNIIIKRDRIQAEILKKRKADRIAAREDRVKKLLLKVKNLD